MIRTSTLESSPSHGAVGTSSFTAFTETRRSDGSTSRAARGHRFPIVDSNGSDADSVEKHAFHTWPEGMQSEVLCHIQRRDRLPVMPALEGTPAALASSPQPHDEVLETIQKVKRLKEFDDALQMILKGRQDFHAKWLLELGYRLPWLPEADKGPANKAFVGAAFTFPGERDSVLYFRHATEVNTLPAFKAVLSKVPKLRKDLQAEPLLMLGYRIHHLTDPNSVDPAGHHPCREEAAQSFAAATAAVAPGRPDRQHLTKTQKVAIDELRAATDMRGKLQPETCINQIAGLAALKHIHNGESIRTAAKLFGMREQELEAALGLAGLREMEAGGEGDLAHSKVHRSRASEL